MNATAQALRINDPEPEHAATPAEEQVRGIARARLAPLVRQIDEQDLYPEELMREFGRAGAYASHVPVNGNADLTEAIQSMKAAGEYCLSTAFCMWCQNALTWYVYNSDNTALHDTLGKDLSAGISLGGTGLSNPMKTFFGIEQLNLKGSATPGGYRISGRLPWVSNLGTGHYFAVVFELADNPGKRVMAVVPFDTEGLTTTVTDNFLALGGTRTYALNFRDVHIPESFVLADPVDNFIPKIRAGFILLQAGMAFGMVRSCADHMYKLRKPLGHVNQYLPEQPEQFDEKLAAMEDEVFALARTPFDSSTDYFRRVISARLQGGELAIRAAHNAMLHAGARGYVTGGFAQRRVREAYFCEIVTPASKQLRKMLADLAA